MRTVYLERNNFIIWFSLRCSFWTLYLPITRDSETGKWDRPDTSLFYLELNGIWISPPLKSSSITGLHRKMTSFSCVRDYKIDVTTRSPTKKRYAQLFMFIFFSKGIYRSRRHVKLIQRNEVGDYVRSGVLGTNGSLRFSIIRSGNVTTIVRQILIARL